MKYSPRQYAKALLLILAERKPPEQKELIRRFLLLLSKKGDRSRLGLIVREFEKQHLAALKIKKVQLESVDPVPARVKKEMETLLGHNLLFQEKINPVLIAGIKILVNDELLIDASAATQISRIFSKKR